MAPRHLKLSPVYVIERIVDKRIVNNNVEYLVKWKDYTSEDNTWEPIESFVSKSIVKDFENSLPKNRNPIPLEPSTIESERSPQVQAERSVAQSTAKASAVNPSHSTATLTTQPTIVSVPMAARPTRRTRTQVSRDYSPTPTRRRKVLASGSMSSSGQSKAKEKLSFDEDDKKEVHFDMDPNNGLIGTVPSNERHMKLISEMDEALQLIDDFLIMKKNEYELSRLILIAKRVEGMVTYVRLVSTTNSDHFLFECVPLEIVLGLYPEVVLAYMQKRVVTEYEANIQQATSSQNAN
ncbi:Chromobox protein-like protein [Aphelenchoides besseyi]|nr:Chromobox protein-like protein [Aphelenchoides besseyi]KAI6195389.1 Chromobox protein-like protein [Aphelenchoides besseyi]